MAMRARVSLVRGLGKVVRRVKRPVAPARSHTAGERALPSPPRQSWGCWAGTWATFDAQRAFHCTPRLMNEGSFGGAGDPAKEGLGDGGSGASSAGGFQDPRAAILDAALACVDEEGWSAEALAAGAQELGYPAVAHGMFDGGAADLVDHAMQQATKHMSTAMAGLDLHHMTPNARIAAAVRARLEYIAQWRDTWPQAMAIGALPQNAVRTATALGVAVDEMWYFAGDRSTDMQWYSRRGLLLGVYASTELAMLTDRSPGYADTWEFLDRRIDDVVHFGKAVGEADSVLYAVTAGLGALASGAGSIVAPMLKGVPTNGNPLETLQAAAQSAMDLAQRATGTAASTAPVQPPPSASEDTPGAGGPEGPAEGTSSPAASP